MQKAIVVRAALEGTEGLSWSQEVDRTDPSAKPLLNLLSNGWKVVNTCPMPNDLEGCCLVIVEHPDEEIPAEAAAPDFPLCELNHSTSWLRLQSPPQRRARAWDGNSISLKVFGIPAKP